MEKSVSVWLLGLLIKVWSVPILSSHASVYVQVEFCCFPLSLESDSYTLLLGNKVLNSGAVCQRVCECIIDASVPQTSKELSLTLQSYSDQQLLDFRSFRLDPLQSFFLRVEVSCTSALLKWTRWSKSQVLQVCVDRQCWTISSSHPSHLVTGLRPGTRYSVSVEEKTHPFTNITLTQKLQMAIKTAQCPEGWLAVGWSCYRVSAGILTWTEAQRECERVAPGVQLANLKTDVDFLSISSHLQSHDHNLLLWTALNDRQQEGELSWSDGSAYNLSVGVISSLSANQTDCFALQRNASGAGYFLTSLPCLLQLPSLCQLELLQESIAGLQMESVHEMEAAFHWSYLSLFQHFTASSELSLLTEDRSGRQVFTHTLFAQTQDRVVVRGLYPGHVYYFSLSLIHPSGASQTLGPIFIAKTNPNPPQNITVTDVTPNQIKLSWAAPDSTQDALFDRYFLCWVNVALSTGKGVWLNRGNLSAVIDGLETFHEYRVTVLSVTADGVQSFDAIPLVVITEVRPPYKISISAVGQVNMTLCWEPLRDDVADGYYVQLRPQISQTHSREFWVNSSNCVTTGQLVAGETYEVGVVAERGGNRSRERTIQQTLKPERVHDAVPYLAGTNSVVLFVQMPSRGVYDGLSIAYGNSSVWLPMAHGSSKATVWNLTPGTVYDFQLFVTSRGMCSTSFRLLPVRTCLAPPMGVRAGLVTDSSVEVLWDRAEGYGHSYEALCVDCSHSVMKVLQTRVVFKDVVPGMLCNISVRTEKELFRDSTAVFLSIRAYPSSVTLLPVQRTVSSLIVSWREGPGVCDLFIFSLRNATYNLQTSLRASDDRSCHVDHLPSGSVYTVEVTSVSGERHSVPSAVTVNTLPAPPDDITFIEQEGNGMYITWTHAQGKVDGYRLHYGLAADIPLPRQVDVRSNSVRISDLTPGSDYQFVIQSFLGFDFSQSITRNTSTRPAGLCLLSLVHANSSSATLAWATAAEGPFDFHRVTVNNGSRSWVFSVSAGIREYTLDGLRPGCSYNVTVERVRKMQSGTSATVSFQTVPASPEDVCVVNVFSHSFSLHWLASSGCDQQYLVKLIPDHGNVSLTTMPNGHVQANVSNVNPGTSYTVTVSVVASSGLSSPVSRIVTTIESVPPAPSKPEGERMGSNGILLSWKMPSPPDTNIHSFIIRYKEVCPYPDPTFTEIAKNLDIPETLLNTLNPGATYKIMVAAVNKAGTGPFSPILYFKTAEAPPGMVTNLTAYAQNHSTVIVTWFLPVRINGLINKFAVKAKIARTGQIVHTLELKAEDIMNGALPHCNDAADILSRGTPSPSESSLMTSAVMPPVTLSAIPSSSIWNVPINVALDKLHPFTAYVFEVSAFTTDGEGQIASTMVRMPEAAPEDPPHNLVLGNITSKSLTLSWYPPAIVTGRFSYIIQLYGPEGFISENSTNEPTFAYTGLTPYTRYRIIVRARSAGATGPATETSISTSPEAPSAVSALRAESIDSISVVLFWDMPRQPNGLITQYRVLVLHYETLVQDITLQGLQQDVNKTADDVGMLPGGYNNSSSQVLHRYARSLSNITTATTPSALASASSQPTQSPSSFSGTDSAHSNHTLSHGALRTDLPLTPTPPATPPPWLTATFGSGTAMPSVANTETATLKRVTDLSPVTSGSDRPTILSPAQPQPSTRAAVTDLTNQPRITTLAPGTSNILVLPPVVRVVSLQSDNISYMVEELQPFTEYNFSVSAYTVVGQGPATLITVKTTEQVPSSVRDVLYHNINSTSVYVIWSSPLSPNGKITHYTVYILNLQSQKAQQYVSNTTSILLTGLEKYTRYKLRVAASTAVGESPLSAQDDIFILTPEDVPDSPPHDLIVTNTTSSTATVTWSPPDKPNGIIRLYEVFYGNGTYTNAVNSTLASVTLHNLKPYTLYNVTVRAYTQLGHGDQTSHTLQMLSGEDVPGSAPYDLVYESISPSEVNVSWQPPAVPNGLIVYYSMEYWNATHTLNLSTQAPAALLSNLRKYALYRLSVQAATRVGVGNYTSDILNITTLEDVPSGPVHNLSAQSFGSTAVVISWDPPLEPNGRVFYLLSLQEVGVTHPSINRTDNLTITKTTNDTVFLFTKLRKYFPYFLQVTPATKAGSALNHTSVLNLRTDEDIPSSAPLLAMSRNLSATSMLVSWYAPVEPNGEITDYAIVLQGPGGSNSTSIPDTNFTLTHLMPYTPYNLSISAVNRKGMGPPLMLTLHTDEAGPMSPPRNLSIFNHSSASVWLQWEPSLEPNGLVQHYGFRIVELNTNTVTYQNSSDASTQAELSGFRPHSSYEISVCSYTRAGNGDQYSLPVTFTTNESVSEAVGNLTCSGLDWDSVYMEWEPPVHPNGEILFYLIRSADREVEAHPVSPTRTLVYTFGGLQPATVYTISVAAVNSAGAGEKANCTADTLPESVPDPPQSLSVVNVSSDAVTLSWLRPARVPGLLQGYRVDSQRLGRSCEPEADRDCVEHEVALSVNSTGVSESVTLSPLLKYRRYRVRVAALTQAGTGEPTIWIHILTLPGNPDSPPRAVSVVPSSTGMKIEWDEPDIISGPTSYLIEIVTLDGPYRNMSIVRQSGEIMTVIVGNLTAFTQYSVTVIAFTGDVTFAHRDGKASEPVLVRTLEEEPKGPPSNLTLTVIPEKVTRVYVTFFPPDEPNGNISAYRAYIYCEGRFDFQIENLPIVSKKNNTMMVVIDGLKGGYNYSIRIAAVNGAGSGPTSEVRVTTAITAPPKPYLKPLVALNSEGDIIATSKTITIKMPLCFFSDDNGQVQRIQVIVSEPTVMNYNNVSNWKSVFFNSSAPYFTDKGFPNLVCPENKEHMDILTTTYEIGADETCLSETAQTLCNGPLKPRTHYVFKFRATNVLGHHTDSDYSEIVRTADDRLLTRNEQIILGVLLSFFLALFLILIIYASVRVHQKQKEGGTYSPREAEIIDTKLKLDKLIAVADMEHKEEKINRLLSYRKSLKPISKKAFLQHVEDLCANDNTKFQEEFAELPKLLHDLATSDADLPWNRSKNRFTNIKPYNNNRVKLLSEPGIPGSDYINASFVSGYLCPNEFIATQGPLPGTVADFWRMIWETRSKTIAMLTQCFEKGRIRCHQYWPEDNKPVTVFGDIVITKLTEDMHPDWTVRALRVERHGDYMVVHHFNYTSWPEHGVPESSSTLIQFVKAVRSNRGHDNTTIVVHCSAGVGRAGVFIALDHLIQHVRDHDFVDVYGLVAELRTERMCMVQNLAQYMFLYQSTLDLLTSKGNSQSVWFVNYSALEKMDSLDAMEGDVELEWEETTM
ncbi:phosphatidylinositol phosphatase PTPRQ [Electrophorus electricus]|uniref:phosphatidylinositol phosphatase PTPRQ n=1 Tax=Electrophorus electricus TaxID=8005 RepID=UPI0015D07BCB|nr:phosphatidylinositol phosphatase PTPRQ [Electrophorus electricus]